LTFRVKKFSVKNCVKNAVRNYFCYLFNIKYILVCQSASRIRNGFGWRKLRCFSQYGYSGIAQFLVFTKMVLGI